MKLIPVVDENDEVINYKDFDLIEPNDIYRVSALWITNSKGDVLLAKRAHTKSHDPGKWGPAVAGTVEKGETYDSNIYKEAEEELGLEGFKFQKGEKKRRFGKWNYFGQWYSFVTDKKSDKFVIRKEEVAEVRWFSKNELRNGIKENPSNFLTSVKEMTESE